MKKILNFIFKTHMLDIAEIKKDLVHLSSTTSNKELTEKIKQYFNKKYGI